MPVRNPIFYDPNALGRDLDRRVRGFLRGDTEDYWEGNIHALSNLSDSRVLYSGSFDDLSENNKRFVIARVEHILDVLKEGYLRKDLAKEMVVEVKEFAGHRVLYGESNLQPLTQHPVLYVRNKEIWKKVLELAQRARSDESVIGPAVKELSHYVSAGLESGDLVHGYALENCLEHGEPYRVSRDDARDIPPTLDVDKLERDDVHAFLFAYETCFHP